MGRRIPKSKKHKKIKAIDPFYRGERRITDKDNKKINAFPQNPNEQEIPRKVREIMISQQSLNDGSKRKRRKKRKNDTLTVFNDEQDGERDSQNNSNATFKQYKGETEQSFIKRIQFDAIAAMTQAKLESKFGVSYTETGVVGQENIQHDKSTSFALDKSLPIGLKKVTTTKKKLKRKKIVEAKKEKERVKISNKKGDFSHLKDDIKFGVVVDRPPSLSIKPRKAATNDKNMPKKKSLLLNKFLQKSSGGIDSSTGIDLSKRRKYLSVATRRKLDTERDVVVNAYRELKKKKQSSYM